jgi:hypothetical protein
MKKIAFLFLTITDINFPKIWNSYFKGHKDKYSIYIHPKFPDKSTWQKKHIIKNLRETAWGFIVSAYIELFKEAFKDPDNYKFITISESCVPIQSFDNFYNDVINDERSWIKMMTINSYYKSKLNEHKIQPKPTFFIKHYARMCLNRKHVNMLLQSKSKSKLKFFETLQVGDEFFLTSILPLNKDEYRDFDVIYDDWEYVQKLGKEIKNKKRLLYEEQEKNNVNRSKELNILEKEFQNITKNPKKIIDVFEDLDKIKNCKSYFYRKFPVESNIKKYWKEIIKYHDDGYIG